MPGIGLILRWLKWHCSTRGEQERRTSSERPGEREFNAISTLFRAKPCGRRIAATIANIA